VGTGRLCGRGGGGRLYVYGSYGES